MRFSLHFSLKKVSKSEMSFTFQINRDLKFNHDDKLIEKAEQNKPKLIHETIKATRIVEIAEDSTKAFGYKAVDSEKDINKLPEYLLSKDQSLILDFGDHRVGRFSIDIASVGSPMDAPLTLRLKFAEIIAELKADANAYKGWLSSSWIQNEVIHLDELPAKLELPRRYSFRYVELEVLDTSPKWSASFSNPIVVTDSAVSMSDLKKVDIKDPLLKRIDEIGVKTLADCMQDVFEDGPKRDRRLWLGDLRLQALANYETFGNKELVKRCLYLFAGLTCEDGRIVANVFHKPKLVPDDTFLFDYSLFFISTLKDYYDFSHDLEIVKELYPIAIRQLKISLSYLDNRNILKAPEGYMVFIDWSNSIDKEASGQAVIIYVLKQFLFLAELIKDDYATEIKELIEKTTKASLDLLYDKQKHLFTSGEKKEINIASQAWMVLAHVLPDEENKIVMQNAVKELFPVKDIATPYMYHHIALALLEAGLKEDAIALIKHYWGKMVELGADTFWEAFMPQDPNFSPYGSPIVNSYCHAWSCTATYLIRKFNL